MDNYSNYWNKKLPENLLKGEHDVWLEKYGFDMYDENSPFLDLGCGNGEDTKWLKQNNFEVVSCDFAPSSIERVKSINKNAFVFDMREKESWKTFKDNTFSYVIADLSLHYFNEKTTNMILKEIKRILIPNGKLIARVNAVNDTVFGAGDGIEIEPNFYRNTERGIDKRFFSIEDANKFFSTLGNIETTEKSINYLGRPKQCIEIVATKKE